jgi:mRNA interferase HicA
MKFSELHRKLQKAGWYIERHGNKHDIWGHPDKPGVLIPVGRHGSQEVKKGTYESIMKAAGLK